MFNYISKLGKSMKTFKTFKFLKSECINIMSLQDLDFNPDSLD